MTPALKPVEVAARQIDDVYLVRDDLAQSYHPANALERMLITQMAQSWLRLQRAHAAEERYFETHDLLEAISNDFDRYKAITRLVTDCERAWRHAMLHIEKAQRRRKQAERTAPPPRSRPQAVPHAPFAAATEPHSAAISAPALACTTAPASTCKSEPASATITDPGSACTTDPASACTTDPASTSISGAGTLACSRLSSRPPRPAELAATAA